MFVNVKMFTLGFVWQWFERDRNKQNKISWKTVCWDFDASQKKAPYSDTINLFKKETDLHLCFMIEERGSTGQNTA